jgi:hypothetical protein
VAGALTTFAFIAFMDPALGPSIWKSAGLDNIIMIIMSILLCIIDIESLSNPVS